MLELSDSRTQLVLAAAAAGAVTVWLFRPGSASAPAGACPTGFEAYLRNKEVVRPQQAVRQPQFAATSFEAYLRQSELPAAADATAAAAASTAAPGAPPNSRPVTVLYGTEYGFSREVAEKACERLKAASGGGYWPQLLDMADVPGGLPGLGAGAGAGGQHQALLLVCSTQGDGVPPTEAREFCDWLASSKAPSLAGLPFSVCALGDRSYQHFCRCGKTLDARLEALGGARLSPRMDVNREDWAAINDWIDSVLLGLDQLPLKTVAELGSVAATTNGGEGGSITTTKRWGKSRPYMARVVAVQGLCTLSSRDDKNTVRVELDLGDSGLQYTPGDALGVWPTNCPQAVEELLEVLGADGDLAVPVPAWHYADAELAEGATSMPLRDALSRCYDLRQPKLELLQLLHAKMAAEAGASLEAGEKMGSSAKQHHVRGKDSASELSTGVVAAAIAQDHAPVSDSELAALLADPAAAEQYLAPRHVIDLLLEFQGGARLAPTELLGALRQLQPRLYSISSSQLEDPQRVQATVAIVRYTSLHADRIGVCSTLLGERVKEGQLLPVYIHKNPDFRLPADPSTPIIMVGPGTGLAPFRAFMQERILAAAAAAAPDTPQDPAAAASAPAFGQCVLYFGCRRRDQDFLYGSLLEGWAQEGKLTLFTAFSREQAQKVYVQDRLAQSSDLVWRLLQADAHFYVCGDAGSMAGAVERQLLSIIQSGLGEGAGPAEAEAYLRQLSGSGRYQRDVWLS